MASIWQKQPLWVQLALIFITLIISYIFLLWITSLLPDKKVRENIKESVELILNEDINDKSSDPFFHLYEPIFNRYNKKNKATNIDYYTDAITLNNIYNIDSQRALASALENKLTLNERDGIGKWAIDGLKNTVEGQTTDTMFYDRYWHGQTIVVRPLLYFSNYLDIKRMNIFFFYSLFLLTIIVIARKQGLFVAGAFGISMLIGNYWVVPMCLQYSPVFYIALFASLIVVTFPRMHLNTFLKLIFIAGSLATFFDILTAPLVTLGIPLILYLFIHKDQLNTQKTAQNLTLLFRVCFVWAIGYICTWLTKAVVIFLMNPEHVGSFMNQIVYRLSDKRGTSGFFELCFLGLAYNIMTLLTQYFWEIALAIVVMIITWLKYRKKQINKTFYLYLMIAALPYLWYIVIANHSYLHSFMTYRIQIITIFGLLLAYSETIHTDRLKQDLKYLFSGNRQKS